MYFGSLYFGSTADNDFFGKYYFGTEGDTSSQRWKDFSDKKKGRTEFRDERDMIDLVYILIGIMK